MSYASGIALVPLMLFLFVGVLGLVLTLATSRFRRGQRTQMVVLAAALPGEEHGSASALMQAGRIAVRTRRLGFLLGIAAMIAELALTDARYGETFFVFGCGYLATIAVGEELMPKPVPGRIQRAALAPRRSRDYVPRWLRWALHLSVALGVVLCMTTIIFDIATRASAATCTIAVGSQGVTFTYVVENTSLPLAIAMTIGFAAIWLATRRVLGVIARRGRPSGHLTLVAMDDALRKASAVRVSAAGLGAALLTLPVPLFWLESPVLFPCSGSSQSTDSVIRVLSLAFIVAGLAAFVVAPSGLSLFRQMDVPPDAGTAVAEPAAPAPTPAPGTQVESGPEVPGPPTAAASETETVEGPDQ